MRIRTYGLDGSLCRPLFLEQLLDLEKRSKVLLRRSRNGKVLAAHYCYEDVDTHSRPNALPKWRNTNYTCREHIGERRRILAHKPLPYRAADAQLHFVGTPAEIDTAVRMMFLQVMAGLRQTVSRRA